MIPINLAAGIITCKFHLAQFNTYTMTHNLYYDAHVMLIVMAVARVEI